jgi:hypothetical protein
MATAGSRDKNLFKLGGKLQGTTYYLLVDTDGVNKGRITIKTKTLQGNITGSDGDRTVGFIPLDNNFQPSTTTNPEEIEYFSSAVSQKIVKNQGVITVQKSGVSQQQARQLIFPNTATPTGISPVAPLPPDESDTGGPVGNDRVDKLSTQFGGTQSGISVGNKLDGISVIYPKNMSDGQDRIIFSLKEITGRDFSDVSSNEANFSFGTKKIEKRKGFVVLPIQPSISDSSGVDWGGANLDPLSAYAARASLSIMNAGTNVTSVVADKLREAGDELKDNFGKYRQAINLYLAQEAVGAQGLLSRGTGSILNPNLELLFNGPTLRSFNFTFRLSPREKSEADDVKKIIYFFKAGMSVRKANTGVFLKSPFVFDIQYQSGNSEHKSLNRIKTCALLGCDVDYTPDGSYMTFNDEQRTMTSYQLTLRFSELDPIYNTDYEEDHPIGY